jgi:hypothetical protein
MTRPYRWKAVHDENDAVQMIGHDHPRVQRDVLGVAWDGMPTCLNDRTQHRVIEQTCPAVGTDGDEAGPGAGVVAAWNAIGATVVFLRTVFHRGRLQVCWPRMDVPDADLAALRRGRGIPRNGPHNDSE